MTGKSRLTLHQLERREALKKTAALGAATIAPLGFPAIVRGQSDTIKLGHITPRTGFLGQLGEYGFRGSSLAVEEINSAGGVLGRKFEVIAEDSVNPQTAVTKAQKLIERDKVVALIGEISSASGLAIGEQALRLKTPYFNTGCNSDELRGKNCNRFMFHIEGCNTMYTKTIGSWQKAQNKIKGANWYMLTADYAFGHDLFRVSSRFLSENGGKVLANEMVPTNTTDYSAYILKVRQAKPDFVYINLAGADQTTFLKQYKEYNLPFPLLSDHSLATFKAWRCFDDFENRPLHGTFLVDGNGKLQWWDIGPEPFMNVDFLIEESKRLLAIEATLSSPGKSPGSPCTPPATETQAAVQPAAQ